MSDLFDTLRIAQTHPCEVASLSPHAESPSDFIQQHVASGAWRPAVLPGNALGLHCDLPVYFTERKTNPVVHDWHGDGQTYCPPLYWDLAVGSGSCGLGCRGCYLLGTFRDRRDPFRPVLYDNVAFIWNAACRWLRDPRRLPIHTLGLGTDRSDSLLYEGVLGHVRELAPMFADPARNRKNAKLLLLTKSRNSHYLCGLPTRNVIVSFSLNPEFIADLWEGKRPITLERITPHIADRMQASLEAQHMGFEVRWRLDPILTPEGWLDHYRTFLGQAADAGHNPTRITLGTYRESTPQLHRWRSYWNVPDMEWKPSSVHRDGTHWHIPQADRVAIYRAVAELCSQYLPQSVISICKETKAVRQATGLISPACNCVGEFSSSAGCHRLRA